jgi:tripartite-type tricarboxylate transporter receptor subunit TctC
MQAPRNRARCCASLTVAAFIFAAATPSAAQTYPSKPVRVVADTAGGGTDFVARILARGLTDSFGQQFVVENRGGAAGDIGIGYAAKQAPDGYTLLVWSNGMWTLPFLRSTSYDPVRDFSPITLAVSSPNVLVVHPSLPVKSVKELIALAKARPNELTFASGGPGTTSHIAAELFKSGAAVKMLDVPYKGAAPGIAALLGGEVQVMFPIASSIVPHINSGRMRALAVTSAQPTPLFPTLPTIAASGVRGYETTVLYGVFAPARTPAALINQLNQALVRLLNTADVKDRFFTNGTEIVASSPEQLAATLNSEMARIGKVIKEAGIRAE